jgi:hypothetical protein
MGKFEVDGRKWQNNTNVALVAACDSNEFLKAEASFGPCQKAGRVKRRRNLFCVEPDSSGGEAVLLGSNMKTTR